MIKSRLLLVFLVILVFFTGLVIKLVDIQVIKKDELKYFALRQHLKEETVLAARGLIYDRNDILLAYNRNDYSLFIDKRQTTKSSREKIAETFGKLFSRNKSYYMGLLKENKNIICLEKKAPGEKTLYLQSYKEPGFFYVPNPTRIYQYGNLAAHLLGYVDADFEGRNGIEQYWNKSLKGIEGRRIIERNGLGDITSIADDETKAAIPGNSIVLTINKNIQNILEEELREGLSLYGGTSASGIIVDPDNGEILALANIQDYDPNNYSKYSNDIRRNRIVTDTYEPGSTFKSFSIAALIDKKLCSLNEKVFVENGKYKFNGVYIRDTHKHEWLTAKEIIEQSSNIGISKLIQRIDNETFYKYLRGFGFGSYTSVDLPSESKGRLKMPAGWNKLTKTFISYGYEVSVTPLQLAMAYSALLNGGILYQPQLVKKEISPSGVILYESSPKEVRQIISAATSDKIRELLKGVVKNGSGKNAFSNLVETGGKTGTSQKLVNGNYSSKEYNSSFAGFFPADNPKAVCVILVNSPSVGRYGGLVAAPIFKNIAEKVVVSDPVEFQPPANIKEVKDEIKIIYAADSKKENNNQEVKSFKSSEENSRVMPDLRNYTVRDAIQVLSKLGIKYKIKGTGNIVQQSIMPGEKLRKNISCELICNVTNPNKAVVY